MSNSTFRVRICHATRELFAQFATKSKHLSDRQREKLLCGGVR